MKDNTDSFEPRCPNCNNPVGFGKAFCDLCGTPVVYEQDNVTESVSGNDLIKSYLEASTEKLGKNRFICPNCGAEVDDVDDSCESCGTVFDEYQKTMLYSEEAAEIDTKGFDVSSAQGVISESANNKCTNCGKALSPNAVFCDNCGAAVANSFTKPQYFEPNPLYIQNVSNSFNNAKGSKETQNNENKEHLKNNKNNNPKHKTIIYIILIVLLSACVVCSIFLLSDNSKGKNITLEKIESSIKEKTNKTIIKTFYDDFDGDGNKEGFAVVGTNNKDTGGFDNGDIWFVDFDETEKLESNISGSLNGIIDSGKAKYVSFEVSDSYSEEGQSFSHIYGVADGTSYEPKISGKYIKVHQDGTMIVCEDVNGNSVEIQETDEKWTVIQLMKAENGDSSAKALTKGQVETFENTFTALMHNISPEKENGFDKLNTSDAYKAVISNTYSVYYCYYDESVVYYYSQNAVKDPRGRLSDDGSTANGHWSGYICREADKVEWILQNVLNVNPDRKNYNEGALSEYGVEYYLEDDYYYTETYPNEDVCTVYMLENYNVTKDGRYELILASDSVTGNRYKALCELRKSGDDEFLSLLNVKKGT